MSIEGDYVLSSVGERQIDLAVVQLLESSQKFRQWFFDRTISTETFDKYLGSARSVSDSTGESDIETGFLTDAGYRHIVLVENKITEPKQDNQVERYYKRGERRVKRSDWDSFSVCLIAPDDYVSRTERDEFESVVLYEEIVEVLESLDYDGKEFILSLFDQAITKSHHSGTSKISPTTDSIADRIRSRKSELPDVRIEWMTRKNVRIQSEHPSHPEIVFYRAFVADFGADGKTEVRISIENGDDEEAITSIKSVIADHIDELPGYEFKRTLVDEVVKLEIWHEDHATDETEGYIKVVADEFCDLINFFHPIFVEETDRGALSQ